MDFWIPLVITAVIITAMGIYSSLSLQKKHAKSTDNVVNYNSWKSKFIYKVNLTRDEIIAILLTPCAGDFLTCTFDYDMSKITFSDFLHRETFYLTTEKRDNFTILRLELKYFHGEHSAIKFKLNPFIISKLKAEPLPFSEYDS